MTNPTTEYFKDNILTQLLNSIDVNNELHYFSDIKLTNKQDILKLVVEIIAFSNTRSGYIILGVNEAKKINGMKGSLNSNLLYEKIDQYIYPKPNFFYYERNQFINNKKIRLGFLYIEQTGKIHSTNQDGIYINKMGKNAYYFRADEIYILNANQTQKTSQRYLLELINRNKLVLNENINMEYDITADTISTPKVTIERPDYSRFIGRDKYITDLIDALKGRHFIISLSGIGGVGKTALAREVSERLSKEGIFTVIWNSSKIDKLTAIGIEKLFINPTTVENLLNLILDIFNISYTSIGYAEKYKFVNNILRSIPCLIVIDNYETIEDSDIDAFISGIPAPSKILITSRKRPESASLHINLNKMSMEEAKQLIEMDADDKGIIDKINCDEKTCQVIYDASGGIPLAIRWIVGMIGRGSSIDFVIDKLKNKDSPVLDFCFTAIYDNVLSVNAKKLLVSFPIYDESPDQTTIENVTNFNGEKFDGAMAELLSLSLVYVQYNKDDNKRKFSMLPLTKAYALSKLKLINGLEKRYLTRYNQYKDIEQTKQIVLEKMSDVFEDLGAITDNSKMAIIQAQSAYATYQDGNYPRATELLKDAIKLDNKNAYVYKIWGTVELAQNNIIDARRLFEEAKRLDDDDPITWFNLGKIEESVDDLLKAKSIYLMGISKCKDITNLEYRAALIDSKQGYYKWSYDEYVKLNQKLPDEAQLKIYVISGMVINLKNWGISEERNKQIKNAESKFLEAVQVLDQGLKLQNTNPVLLREKFLVSKNLGILYLNTGDFKNAETKLLQSLNHNDWSEFWNVHNSFIYQLLGETMKKTNNIDKSIYYCKLSLEKNAKNENARRLLNSLLKKH